MSVLAKERKEACSEVIQHFKWSLEKQFETQKFPPGRSAPIPGEWRWLHEAKTGKCYLCLRTLKPPNPRFLVAVPRLRNKTIDISLMPSLRDFEAKCTVAIKRLLKPQHFLDSNVQNYKTTVRDCDKLKAVLVASIAVSFIEAGELNFSHRKDFK